MRLPALKLMKQRTVSLLSSVWLFGLVMLPSGSSPKSPPWAGCSLHTKAGVILLASSPALL